MIRLLCFASARDRLGAEPVLARVEGETAAGLRVRLAGLYPGQEAWLATCRFALADRYLDDDEPIGAAHEVAVIPPVSGG